MLFYIFFYFILFCFAFNLFNCLGSDDDADGVIANVTQQLGRLGTASSLYVKYSGLEEQRV